MSNIYATNPLPSAGYTEEEMPFERIESTGDANGQIIVPAGKYSVHIENAGAVGTGTTSLATVNGDPLEVDGQIKFNFTTDPATCKVLKSPEYVIKTNGAMIYVEIHG